MIVFILEVEVEGGVERGRETERERETDRQTDRQTEKLVRQPGPCPERRNVKKNKIILNLTDVCESEERGKRGFYQASVGKNESPKCLSKLYNRV